jgi:hypothetical protein
MRGIPYGFQKILMAFLPEILMAYPGIQRVTLGGVG